jgi:ABC-type transport system involved in cytochrome bd biosynthesis fused ATPase/permease subunit
VPAIRPAAVSALVIGALTAVAIVVQAVALSTVIARSLLHHDSLSEVLPELIAVALAVAARAALALIGERMAQRTAESVVTTLRGQLLRKVFSLGPSWLSGERPGELSLTATRGLRSLDAYFTRYLPQAATAIVVPVVLLVWVATQDWLSLVVIVALVVAVPVTMIYFGREATRRTERQWRRLGSLAGRFLQLIEGLPTLRAFGRDGHGAAARWSSPPKESGSPPCARCGWPSSPPSPWI